MFGKRNLLKGVVSLVVFGLATCIVARMDAGTKTIDIDDYPLGQDIVLMSVAYDLDKKLQVDGSLLTEVVSSALKNRYGEKLGVVGVHFNKTIMATGPKGVYWDGGIYYRLQHGGIEYIKIPVKLNLEIGGQFLQYIRCQWEVSFQADERWENISVNTMRISSCRHHDIDFTSNVFVDILSERLDDVFVYPDMQTGIEERVSL